MVLDIPDEEYDRYGRFDLICSFFVVFLSCNLRVSVLYLSIVGVSNDGEGVAYGVKLDVVKTSG